VDAGHTDSEADIDENTPAIQNDISSFLKSVCPGCVCAHVKECVSRLCERVCVPVVKECVSRLCAGCAIQTHVPVGRICRLLPASIGISLILSSTNFSIAPLVYD